MFETAADFLGDGGCGFFEGGDTGGLAVATGGFGVSAAFEFGFDGALEFGSVPERGEVVGDAADGIGWGYEVVGGERGLGVWV